MRHGGGQDRGSSGKQSSNSGRGAERRSCGAERHVHEHGGGGADVERRRRWSPGQGWGTRRRVRGHVVCCSPNATCSLCV